MQVGLQSAAESKADEEVGGICEQKQLHLICQGYPLKPRTFYSKEAIQTRVVGEWLCIGL